uniref:Triggering receptor expressed on myeloid cells-like 1 n=1 Tax=Nannospalax galili TaxID=1026970 RepID=A0A8C6W9R5_NANGA
MDPCLLLLLFLVLTGQGSADNHPEVLQAPVGSSILVQCHYRLQDVRAHKVWCRFLQEGCQPLVTSAVDRRAPGNRRTFLTDLGGGLLQVEMVALQEEDTGEYGCVVEGTAGPQTVHTVSLQVLPPVPGSGEEEEVEEEEQVHKTGSLPEEPSLDPEGSASPWEFSRYENSVPLIWGAVFLLGLLVAAVVMFAVMARRKGRELPIHLSQGMDWPSINQFYRCGQESRCIPHTKELVWALFNQLYLPLPPKILMSSKSDIWDRGEGASSEPAQDLPSDQAPPS